MEYLIYFGEYFTEDVSNATKKVFSNHGWSEKSFSRGVKKIISENDDENNINFFSFKLHKKNEVNSIINVKIYDTHFHQNLTNQILIIPKVLDFEIGCKEIRSIKKSLISELEKDEK